MSAGGKNGYSEEGRNDTRKFAHSYGTVMCRVLVIHKQVDLRTYIRPVEKISAYRQPLGLLDVCPILCDWNLQDWKMTE